MKTLFHSLLKTMLASLLLIACAAITAHGQGARLQLGSLDALAGRASQTVDVNIDQRLMQLTAKFFSSTDPDEKQVKELINGLKGIYVKSFEFEKEGEYSEADVETIRAQVRGPAWSKILNFTSKKEGNVEVYLMTDGDHISGLAVLATELKELTVVNIVGPVDLEKLSKLEGQFGVPDLDIEVPAKTKPKN
jgi:hypothetical protein